MMVKKPKPIYADQLPRNAKIEQLYNDLRSVYADLQQYRDIIDRLRAEKAELRSAGEALLGRYSDQTGIDEVECFRAVIAKTREWK